MKKPKTGVSGVHFNTLSRTIFTFAPILRPLYTPPMLSLIFYVPEDHLEIVKAALFEAGAGRLGNYDQCCWQTKGTGQFRPLPGSDPHLGKQGTVERVDEWKVEMVCEESRIEAVIAALKRAHPYETAAYLVVKPQAV